MKQQHKHTHVERKEAVYWRWRAQKGKQIPSNGQGRLTAEGRAGEGQQRRRFALINIRKTHRVQTHPSSTEQTAQPSPTLKIQ